MPCTIGDLGTVEIPWGRTGKPRPLDPKKPSYWDGYGVSRILAKHKKPALDALPEVLAKGEVLPHPEPSKHYVVLGKWQAILGKTSPHSAWAITNFDPREKMSTWVKRNRPAFTGRLYKKDEHEIVEASALLGAPRFCLGAPRLPPGPQIMAMPQEEST